MTAYTWELGIDWNALETEGRSYLRQGLVKQDPLALASAILNKDDTIQFRIFDVTSTAQMAGPQVSKIDCFTCVSNKADNNQSIDNALTALPHTVTYLGARLSTTFEGYFPAWNLDEVTVLDIPGRYLLTFQAQADGCAGGSPRCFCHDPEMVVGPNT